MNGSVKDWIAKADGDFDVAQLALRAEHRPNYDAVCAAHPSWTPVAKELRFLTQGAILFRYPGESATPATAEQAMAVCRRLRGELLGLLQTPGG